MDCLIVKTSASVSDATLLKLDEFRVHIQASSATTFKFKSTNQVVTNFRIIGDGYFVSNGQKELSLNCFSEQTISISSGTYELVIGNKYKADRLTLPTKSSLDFDSFAYVTLSQLQMRQMVGEAKIKDINTSRIIDLDLQYPTGNLLKGSLSDIDNIASIVNLNLDTAGQVTGDLADFTGNTTVRNVNLARTAVAGSLEDFAIASSLTFLNFEGSAGITGSLSDYLDRLATVKTSGAVTIYANNSGITIDVEASSYSPIVARFTSSGWTVD
jgi:hypothetical protein